MKFPLHMGSLNGSLYTENVNLLFSQCILTTRNENVFAMFMFKSKCNVQMFSVLIFCKPKLFLLIMRIKSDKNIINITTLNFRKNVL